MDDQPYVVTHADGPEVGVPGLVELVELQSRVSRVHLQIEGRGLGRFLLVAG